MNQKVKEKWIQALRSEQYVQGHSYLERNNEYCCLGVLTKLAEDDGVDLPQYWGQAAGLPQKVREWAGLEEQFPAAGGAYLHVMNDILDFSFRKIAEEIEKYL